MAGGSVAVKIVATMAQDEKGRKILGWIIGGIVGFIVLIAAVVGYLISTPVNTISDELFNGEEIPSDLLAFISSNNNQGDATQIIPEGLKGKILTRKEIKELTENYTSVERRELVQLALSLVGKVDYFWGGRSKACDWNPQWGTLKKVTAPGSQTTGTYQPFGLDCSGFTDWAYRSCLSIDIDLKGSTATTQFTSFCKEIKAKDLQMGDLAFVPTSEYSKESFNHVGIYVGENKDGERLYVHAIGGGIQITTYSLFTVFGRVKGMQKFS